MTDATDAVAQRRQCAEIVASMPDGGLVEAIEALTDISEYWSRPPDERAAQSQHKVIEIDPADIIHRERPPLIIDLSE